MRLLRLSGLSFTFLACLALVFQSQQLQAMSGFGPSITFLGYLGLLVVAFFAGLKVNLVRRSDRADYWLLLFSFYIASRALLSTSRGEALESVLVLIAAGFGVYFVTRIALAAANRPRRIVVALGIVLVVTTLPLALLMDLSTLGERMTLAEGHHAVAFSQVIVASNSIILAAVFWVVFGEGRGLIGWRRTAVLLLCIAALAICIRMAVASGTRSSLVALAAVIVLLLLWRLARGSAERLFLLALLAFAGVILMLFALPPSLVWLGDLSWDSLGERWSRMFYLAAAILDPTSVTTYVGDMAVAEREYLREFHWVAFREYVWFGAGPALVDAGPMVLYPHNLFLELLSYYGIVGVTLFGVFLLTCARRAIWLARRLRLDLAGLIAVAMTVGALTQLQFSFTLWMSKSLFFGLAAIVTLYEVEQRPLRETRNALGSEPGLELRRRTIGMRRPQSRPASPAV